MFFEVLWQFKYFVVFCSVNLAIVSANLKTDGVTWKVIENLRCFSILITEVVYNLHPLNSHALHILHVMEHPTVCMISAV